MPRFDLQDILIRVLVVTVSLSFHEFAHARVAYALGDDTAKQQGRLTMNPLSHLDPIGTLMFILARIGWAKPVPINPTRFRREIAMRKGIVLVSLAGPVANLIIATIAYALLVPTLILFPSASAGFANIPQISASIFSAFFISNIYLAIFNLLPLPPLDGYKIFGALLPKELYYRIMQYERYLGIALLLLFMLGSSWLSSVMQFLATPFIYIITTPINWLAKLFTA